MTNKDLIQQYVATGLKIPEKQLAQLSDNQKKSYYRARLIAIKQNTNIFVMDYEYEMAPEEIKRKYFEELPFDEFGNLVVKKSDTTLFNILKKDGTYLLDRWYDNIIRSEVGFKYGYYYVNNYINDVVNFFDRNGNLVFKNWPKKVFGLRTSGPYIGISIDYSVNKQNVFNFKTGKLEFDQSVDISNLRNLKNGFVVTNSDNKLNIWVDGHFLLNQWYYWIDSTSTENVFIVTIREDGKEKSNVLVLQGDTQKLLSDVWYDEINESSNNKFLVKIKKTGNTAKINYMDINGELLSKWETVRFSKY